MIRIILTPEQKAAAAAGMAQELNDLKRGKISIRWNHGRVGFVIYSGRYVCTGIQSFMFEEFALAYLKDTHGIEMI
jgi:hypothetical protein